MKKPVYACRFDKESAMRLSSIGISLTGLTQTIGLLIALAQGYEAGSHALSQYEQCGLASSRDCRPLLSHLPYLGHVSGPLVRSFC